MNPDPKPPILSRYPKKRPALPEAYEKIYQKHYQRNREGRTKVTSLSSRLERWLHLTVAADAPREHGSKATLEIGAGTLNHLPYEPFSNPYDIIEPYEFLWRNAPHLRRIRHIYRDISEIEGRGGYDRIISIATFEHITDLPAVIARAVVLLKPDGVLRVSIPNEGTLLWKLGTYITGFEFKRMYGLDYQVLMKHEHVNKASEISSILHYFFNQVREKNFGPTAHLAFYRFFECRNPDLYLAKKLIDR